jgi:hypothetical protein
MKPITYKFKSASDAKKFVSAITVAGINQRNIRAINKPGGKTVSIAGVKDKEMVTMIGFLAKEMKAIKEETTMNDIISSIQEALESENGVNFEPKDGTNIHITQEDATNLTSVHDTLIEENQKKMRALLEESEEDYTKVLDFCNNQFDE